LLYKEVNYPDSSPFSKDFLGKYSSFLQEHWKQNKINNIGIRLSLQAESPVFGGLLAQEQLGDPKLPNLLQGVSKQPGPNVKKHYTYTIYEC